MITVKKITERKKKKKNPWLATSRNLLIKQDAKIWNESSGKYLFQSRITNKISNNSPSLIEKLLTWPDTGSSASFSRLTSNGKYFQMYLVTWRAPH